MGRRPSIGAVRRSKQAAASGTAPDESVLPEPSPPSEPAAAPATPPPPAAAAARPVDRDSLTEAWGDGVLQSLPARAKARYASGRFVAVDEQGAHFALPNAAHRDQCVEHQGLVEAALGTHFGTEVHLVLVVDDAPTPAAPVATAPPPDPGAASARPGRPAPPDDVTVPEDLEEVDPAEFVEAGSAAEETAAAEARLLEAFPGASEVAG